MYFIHWSHLGFFRFYYDSGIPYAKTNQVHRANSPIASQMSSKYKGARQFMP